MLNRLLLTCIGAFIAYHAVMRFDQTHPVSPPNKPVVELKIPVLVQSPRFLYTNADIDCLRDNIFYEARNQSPEGMNLVGIVTIERAFKAKRSICQVVHAHAQFSWTLTKHKPNLKNKIERDAYVLTGLYAENLLINANNVDTMYKNLVYYHKTTIHPKWAKSSSLSKEFIVGDHVFYSEVGSIAQK